MDPKQRQFSIWYVFIALWAIMLFQIFVTPYFNPTEIPYSEFKAAVTADKVEEVSISSSIIHGRMKTDAKAETKPEVKEEIWTSIMSK
jgi:cell division protease FtsH